MLNVFFSFFTFISCASASDKAKDSSTNLDTDYKNGSSLIELLDKAGTLKRFPQIKLTKNPDDTYNITIKADNRTLANFYSKDPCGNNDVFAYRIIGSISNPGIIILDKYDGCDAGVNCILVSVQDGIMRELQINGVFDLKSFLVSPDGSCIAVSAFDCSMGLYSQLEILSVRGRTNSLLNTAYFNEKYAALDKSNPWTSANSLSVMSVTDKEIENNDCKKIKGELRYDGSKWMIR